MKKLDKMLIGLSELDFAQLRLRMQVANSLRAIEKDYTVSIDGMAKHLEITSDEYRRWRNGAKDFDLKMMAKINVLSDDLHRENSDMFQIQLDADKKKVRK
jgi:hypothetical protein